MKPTITRVLPVTNKIDCMFLTRDTSKRKFYRTPLFLA